MSGHPSYPPLAGETETERRRRAQRLGAERRAEGEIALQTDMARLYRAYGGHAVLSTRDQEDAP